VSERFFPGVDIFFQWRPTIHRD